MRARSNNETREDIIGQIAVSKMYGDTFRDDLLQKLPDAFARARGNSHSNSVIRNGLQQEKERLYKLLMIKNIHVISI